MTAPSAPNCIAAARRPALLTLFAIVSLLLGLIGASSASAAYLHPEETASFGPNGADGSFGEPFGSENNTLEIDQARHRLYYLHPELWSNSSEIFPPQISRGIYAFDISTPGVRLPLGGGFPITLLQPKSAPFQAVDASEGRIDYFDVQSTGGAASPNGIYGTWSAYGVDGTPLGANFPVALGHLVTDVTVDSKGYVWMIGRLPEGGGHYDEKLYKYDPDGVLLETVAIPSLISPNEIVFDRFNDDLWVRGFLRSDTGGDGGTGLLRLTASSGYSDYDRRFNAPGGGGPGDLALDSTQHILYLAEGPFRTGRVSAYNETGGKIETFATGGSYKGIAVDESTGDVYLNDHTHPPQKAELGGKIRVWSGTTVPNVSTQGPTGIEHAGATVHGHVGTGGGPEITSCAFQYTPDSAYREVQKVSLSGATGGTFKLLAFVGSTFIGTTPIAYNASPAEVQTALEGHPAIGSGNLLVTSPNAGGEVGVAGGPYRIEFSSKLGDVSQLYNDAGSLVPGGTTVSVETVQEGGGLAAWAEPGTTPCAQATPISEDTDVSTQLTGLTSGEIYHYRLTAGNSNGVNVGTDEVVAPQPSITATGEATSVQRTSATLNGTTDPEGHATTFYFEYGTSTYYGETSTAPPGQAVGSEEAGAKPVSAALSALTPDTIYHYRLVAVNSKGTSYGADRTFQTPAAVKHLETDPATEIERDGAMLNGTLDPDGFEVKYYFEWGKTRRYGDVSAVPPGNVLGTNEAGDKPVSVTITGLQTATTYHYRLVASNPTVGVTVGEDRTFTTLVAVVGLDTDPPTEVKPTTAKLHGHLDPDGIVTTYYFQWGKTPFYGHTTTTPPGEDVGTIEPGSVALQTQLEELEPGVTYHYRLAAQNSFGVTFGADQSFRTPQGPAIEGVFSTDVTASTANLRAQINPDGTEASFETTYRFEYGTSTAYGNSAPALDGTLAAGSGGQSVTVPISGLSEATYHFRLVAENHWGTTISEDQTFDFNPPSCPNAAIRQQTRAAYLPDCRAYELVSPGRAGGAALFAEGPVSPTAAGRLAFRGLVNVIPGTGEPPNGGSPFPFGDLYVASRTARGWVTRYVGIPATQAINQGGIPDSGLFGPSGIPTDLTMSRFLTWKQRFTGTESYAPYLWDNEGNFLGRLPSNLESVVGATSPVSDGGFVGATVPSPDFSHYVFSSRDLEFAPGGLTSAPGSAYDDDLASATVTLVSKTAAGADIPQDAAAGGSSEYIRIPAVSTNGSHVVMSTEAASGAVHLYMTVNDAIHYEISRGEDGINHGVHYVGMSADGSKVYFTTAARMTSDDTDTSVDLYRWSQNSGSPSLTRLSVGNEGSGNADTCNPEWAAKCGVEVVPTDTHTFPGSTVKLQPIDNALASEADAVYFYSPEELEGARGVPGKRNLYLWREGSVHFVATLDPLVGAERIDVSADGRHAAFITKSRVGPYDNAGYAEMFSYDAESRSLICVSCHPDGSPPSSDVKGSQNGLFMTDDGRTFFATSDPLVPRDANGITDVYEYVDGRPQLISTGTGNDAGESSRPIGLVGVSANGIDVFVSTYETLVGQDENGPFLKFYDARTNGGFPFNKPPAPCAAADECHGEGAAVPTPVQIGSGSDLGAGGNLRASSKPHRKPHRKPHSKRHRHGHRNPGRSG